MLTPVLFVQNLARYYLHGDHLNKQFLATNQSGNFDVELAERFLWVR